MHCVYIPDVILSIFQMSLLFQNDSESDCVYIPDAMMSIFRMSLLLEKMKMHCVYIPEDMLSIFRMSLPSKKNNESAWCLYSGCHFFYIADVTFNSKRQ